MSVHRTLATGGLSLVLGAGLAAAVVPAATADPAVASAGGSLVISEVYGGGGNSGATLTHDFVELYNPSDQPVSVDGWTIQYRSSGSTAAASGVTRLAGSVPARGHYLVQQAKGAGGTTALPTPDAVGTVAMSGTAFQVWLSDGTTALTPVPGDLVAGGSLPAGIVDFVGVGGAASFETAPTGALSNTTSAARTAAGADTDSNLADLRAGEPSPRNAGSSEPEPEPDPEPVEVSIAEVQGTGTTTPYDQQAVTVRGVVTAAFPTGGFDGFYLQTGGPDQTPGASDGIFVYEPGFPSWLGVGDSVEVTGVAGEFGQQTQIAADEITELASPLPAVEPLAEVPGTDCALPGTGCPTAAELDVLREAHEGEAVLPSAMTVTDAYDFGVTSTSFFGEVGLAAQSDVPLFNPTEVVDAQDADGLAARRAYNDAHRVVLDDGSSAAYWNTRNDAAAQDLPIPWLTPDHTVRVGAEVTFEQPLVLDYRFGWKLQPQRQVVGAPTGLMTFEQDREARPAVVGGDVQVATFNVLNYFTTLGSQVAGCTAYVDRADVPVATNSCPSGGPRGAWDATGLERQQAKIVAAINALDADVVSLEELENSAVVDGGDRDEAIGALVQALNAAAGRTRWAFVPSPDAADIPADEDVIRTGFIYDPATVEPVGVSRILDDPAFVNARDPLAQAFAPVGGTAQQRFAVVVNHFKSKGCSGATGEDLDSGQGCWNPDRVAQAQALTAFADAFGAEQGTERVLLVGDFNAYSGEDPVQVITDAGYRNLESTDDPDEKSYSFGGASGSLDHVFVKETAASAVTGVDIWEINANESVYYQYSRYNYVGTLLYSPGPFAASDHNPELVGLDLPDAVGYDVRAIAVPPIVLGRARVTVLAHITSDAGRVRAGELVVRDQDGEELARARVRSGVITVRLPRLAPGRYDLDVEFVAPDGSASTDVTVLVLGR